ncbi:trissin receptor-like [Haliotis cracherodii]|uniref:trissin receptor-like n=1 Tax=Haliotis cracherodii TaxID=6455 RepID=UPI0039EB2852
MKMDFIKNYSFPNGSYGNVNFSFMPRQNFVNPLSDTSMRILFIAIYAFVFICCFFGNVTVLIVIIKNKRMRTRTNFFLANLAVADFLVGILCIIPNLSVNLSPKWRLGRAMCKIYYFVQNMSYTASMLFLAVIAIERYVAIMHPLRSRQLFTSVRLQIAQVCIWLVASISNVQLLFIFDIHGMGGSDGTYSEYCFHTASIFTMRALATVNIVLWYTVPLGVMAIVYTRISITLWSTSKNALVQSKESDSYKKDKHASDKKPCSCVRLNDSHSSDLDDKEVTKVTCNTGVTENSSSSETRNEKGLKSNLRNGSTNSSSCHDGRRSPNKVRYCLPNDKGHAHKQEKNKTHLSTSRSLSAWQIRRSTQARQSPKLSKRDTPNSLKMEVSTDMYSEVTFSEDTDSIRSRVSVRRPRNTRMSSRKALSSRRRVIKLLMAVLATFAICVLPHHLRLLLHYWQVFPGPNVSLLPPITFIMLYLNSALNPLLYWLFSDSFRRSFKDTFFCCRKMSKTGRYTVT